MSLIVLISMCVINDASPIFGVTTYERGINFSINEDTASSLKRASPLLATMTGSKTYFSSPYSMIFLATTSIMFLLDNIPVLHESTGISLNTASI